LSVSILDNKKINIYPINYEEKFLVVLCSLQNVYYVQAYWGFKSTNWIKIKEKYKPFRSVSFQI